MKNAPNFALSEFACKCGKCKIPADVQANLEKLAPVLQAIRDHFKTPIQIVSGYRCPAHNAAVGGAKASFHMKGIASDIVLAGVPPLKVAAFAKTLPQVGGLHAYVAQGFTHVDIRPRVNGQITSWA